MEQATTDIDTISAEVEPEQGVPTTTEAVSVPSEDVPVIAEDVPVIAEDVANTSTPFIPESEVPTIALEDKYTLEDDSDQVYFNTISPDTGAIRDKIGTSYIEAISATTNPFIAEFLYGLDHDAPADPNWELNVEEASKSGVPLLLIAQGIEDGSIRSQETYDNFLYRNAKAHENHQVLADYHMVTNFVGSIIPAAVDPYNVGDIAITAGLAFLPGGGWAALVAKASIAAGSGAVAGNLSEAHLQRASATYNHEATELATWLGAGIGGGLYGVGYGIKAARSRRLDTSEPEVGTVVIDNITGELREVSASGELVPTTRDLPAYEYGNAASISILGSLKKSSFELIRKLGYDIDVSAADAGNVLHTRDTIRSRQVQFNKSAGVLRQSLNAERKIINLDEASFEKRLNDEYANHVNGKQVTDQYKVAVESYAKYNEFIKQELKKAGVEVKDDYFRHNWNIGKIHEAGQAKFELDYKSARKGHLKKEILANRKELNSIKNELLKLSQKGHSFKKGEKVDITMPDGTVRTVTKGQKRQLKKALNERAAKLKEGGLDIKGKKFDARLNKEAIDAHLRLASKDESDAFFVNVTHGRTIPDIDESFLKDYFHSNISAYVNSNSKFLSGRIATQQALGFSDSKGLEKFLAGLREEAKKAGGHDAAKIKNELRNAETSIKHIWNTQMTPDNPHAFTSMATQVILKTNTMAMGIGFGLTALASEGFTMFTRGGILAGFKAIGMTAADLHNAVRGLPPTNHTMRQVQVFMNAFDTLDHQVYGRFMDGDELVHEGSKFLKGVNYMTNKVMQASFLAPVTENIRKAVGMTKIDDMFNMDISKLTKKDKQHYIRMQFDPNDLTRLQALKEGITIRDANGRDNGLDFTKLPPDLAKSLDRYLGNLSRHDVILGERIHMPSIFSSNNNFAKLFTQYLGFPAQAFESLLLKGFREADARLAVAVTLQSMVLSATTFAKEDLEVKLGLRHEKDRKFTNYDGTTNLGAMALHIGMKSNYLAPVAFMLDTASKTFTGKGLGSGFRQYNAFSAIGGVNAKRLQDTFNAFTTLGLDITDGNGVLWRSAYGKGLMVNGVLPGVYAPMVGKAVHEWNKSQGWG